VRPKIVHANNARTADRSAALLQVAALLCFPWFFLDSFVSGHVATAAVRWIDSFALAWLASASAISRFGFFCNALGLGSRLDWPSFAAQLKILSDIFLRLIK